MRLFIATAIPAVVRDATVLAFEPVRRTLPDASWTRSDTFHFTYAFLGDQKEEILPKLYDALEARLAGAKPIAATLGAAGFFPSARRPRVGWVALAPAEEISAIAQKVRAALGACAVDFDDKPFTPHLTLARPKAPWRPADCDSFSAAVQGISAREFQIDDVSVYSSTLSAKGAQHTELRRIPFATGIGGQ